MPASPQEQLQKLYKALPRELQNAVFSEETAEIINNACEQYGIEDERVSKIAKYVGDVLIGFILPSEFENEIRKNVELPEVLVKPIANEISRFIFYPVKASLEQIHKQVGSKETDKGTVEIPTPRHSDRAGTPQKTEAQDDYVVQEENVEKEEEQAEKPVFSEEQGKKDSYRESLGEE